MLDTDGVRTGQVALGNVAFRGRSPKFSLTLTQTNGEAQRFTISLSLTNITTPTTQHRPAYGVDGMMVKQVSDRSGPPDVGKRSRVLFQSPARVLYNSESYDEMTKCYKLPSVMIKACFSRGLLQSIPCSRQLPAPNFSVMLSLVGREARRSRGIHACGRSVTNSALQYLQLPRKSRGLSTSGSGISYGHDSPDQDVIVVDGVRVHDGATLATCGGWEAQRGSHPSKWETLVSVKMSETLAGGVFSPPQQSELSLTFSVRRKQLPRLRASDYFCRQR